ncbi:hypothetical protein ACQJBY_008283 [Aegilops geniculata]
MAACEAGSRMGRVARECECECGGDISASQEDALAASPFLGAAGDDESEVFATPLDLSQQQEEDAVTMGTLPSTPSPIRSPSPPSPPPHRKPRGCVRKVRVRGAKIRTPTPSPDLPPEPQPQPAQPPEQPEQQPHADADPLYRAVQMVGALTGATTTSSNENAVEDFLALARRRGLL